MEAKETVTKFIKGQIVLDLVDGVKMDVVPFGREYLVRVYDRRSGKVMQGSYLCTADRAINKIREIQLRFGKEG